MNSMKIYVASSWRNAYQPEVVEFLRKAGHEVYDFRNPPNGSKGFAWSDIDENWEGWSTEAYREALNHPVAIDGFNSDFDGMKWADVCVMVLPCGRSANTEAGWMKGAGKTVFVFSPTHQEPELMYKIHDGIFAHMAELLLALRNLPTQQGIKEWEGQDDYGLNELALVERYADNGAFSHYELIDLDTGKIVWPAPPPPVIYGARWVKASERLPEERIEIFIKNGKTRLDGYYSDGAWYDWDGTLYLAQSDTERNFIEWLDESPSPTQPGEEVGKGWTPVEQKPDKKGFYLTYDLNYPSQPLMIGHYQPYNDTWTNDTGDAYHPSHYQLTPAAPTNPSNNTTP